MKPNTKILVTGGCSFTYNTWPKILADQINYNLVNEAYGSQGNGLISKRVIYRVSELLKKIPPENILVGIMWSGFARHELFVEDKVNLDYQDGSLENPIKFIDFTDIRSWLILNHGWSNNYSHNYYKYFSLEGGIIQTLENILRTQWFLKCNNVKYFMTTFTSETVPSDFINRPEISYLVDLVDYDHFLPILGEYEFCNNIQTKITVKTWPPKWEHPTQQQHENFVFDCVIPYLEQKKIL